MKRVVNSCVTFPQVVIAEDYCERLITSKEINNMCTKTTLDHILTDHILTDLLYDKWTELEKSKQKEKM